MMLDFLKFLQKDTSKANHELLAVASGTVIPLESVPDRVFAHRLLGDGVAITPSDDIIVSPVCGKIAMLFPSMHAFGIILPNGIELLVHIGINTVSLKGEGFRRYVNKNDTVKAGDPIIKVDRHFLESEGYNPVVLLIVTEPQGYHFDFIQPGKSVQVNNVIASYNKTVIREE